MTNSDFARHPLPAGYSLPDATKAAYLHAELLRVLTDGHPLFGVPLELFAVRDESPDALFRYRGNYRRFVLVHLTRAPRNENAVHHPAILFDGTFAEFLEHVKEFLQAVE